MKLIERYFIISLWVGLGGQLHAGAVCAESPVVAVETRAFGVCVESNVITVDTRTKLDLWMTSQGLVGEEAKFLATPFADGVTNLVKYACNLNGARADAGGLLPLGTSGLPYPEAGPGRLRMVALRRRDDPGLQYRAHFSQNLVAWTPVDVPAQITPINAVWERVTFESPNAI